MFQYPHPLLALQLCLTSPYCPVLPQVMRYDLVPRFSTAAVEEMQKELLEIDYKGLLHDDLMEHEASFLYLGVLFSV
jgi:hypothetical protein